ncbi:acyl carrier protein [Limnobaculum parvum]|uniref:Acyl carrier protein n=1 Tax=Limnobaculum parvum TaxID=2172103 RepID=A0A2Y9TZV0_9GAMM|nr:acyl carrier protein [Limnobaculum parvum]AWH89060.1 acyl carrier protein [Limnobaculum parvum]
MNYLHESKKILSSCLSIPVEQIQDDSLIEQLKPTLDSVDFASIMMQVERFLKKEVPVAEWLELGSVTDLADLLERNYNN